MQCSQPNQETRTRTKSTAVCDVTFKCLVRPLRDGANRGSVYNLAELHQAAAAAAAVASSSADATIEKIRPELFLSSSFELLLIGDKSWLM